MAEEHPIDRMAKSIGAWAFCDSSVQLDPKRLKSALIEDAATSGRVLTESECEQFICGGEDGEIPANIRRDYPRTHQLLEEHW